MDRTRLFLDADLAVRGPAVRAFQDLVRRRAVGREPVAYLLGRQAFRRLELRVDRRVLIPRPETEHVVEAVVEHAPRGARVVDVGTGSGAIALALADERPDLEVWGSDVSPDALDVARANGERLGLPVRWVHADGVPQANSMGSDPFRSGSGLPVPQANLKGSDPLRLGSGLPVPDWDVVVSNPPYVPAGDPRVEPGVHAHEPHVALYAGEHGLDVIRSLVAAGAPLLVLEVGDGQAQEVARLAEAAGYARTAAHEDLAGIARVVVAWR